MYRQLERNLFNSNISSTCLHSMAKLGPLAAEIGPVVWGTHANFNRFRVFAALLHGTLVVGVSQTLRHWTEGATYIWQGGHHVWHWPTFLVIPCFHKTVPMKNSLYLSQLSIFVPPNPWVTYLVICRYYSSITFYKAIKYCRSVILGIISVISDSDMR